MITPQTIFSPFSPKMLLSSKKLLNEKIFKPPFPIKKVIFIFVARRVLPFKRDSDPRHSFLSFSQKIQLFLKKLLSWEHTWACLDLHRIAPHWIGSVCRCGQHERAEAYAPNMLMRCVDLIWSLLVHQSEHYFVRAQCEQLFSYFSCLGGELAYFIFTPNNLFYGVLRTFPKIIICHKIWIKVYWRRSRDNWEEHLGGHAGTYSQGGGGIEGGRMKVSTEKILYCGRRQVPETVVVIPIKNRWFIIFDWSVGKQSIFFNRGISIIDFWSLNFGMIKWVIFKIFFSIK